MTSLGMFLLTGFLCCASDKTAIADPVLRFEPLLLNQTQPNKYYPIDLLAQDLFARDLNPVIESEEPDRPEMSPSRRQRLISFLYRNPKIIYIFLTAILGLMSLGIVGIWLVLFRLRKLKEPQTIQLDAVTLATLTELRNVFLETQNSLFWLQDYLENATINQSHSRPTSDWSSFSRSIRDSQVFEPDTDPRSTNQRSASQMNHGESESISNSMKANEFLEQGNALLVQGRYEAAIAAYEQSLKLEPSMGQAWLNRGCALFYLQEYEQAIASYDQALHRSGDLPDAWYNRAGALAKLQQYDQAIACYERATQLKPDYVAAWHDRGSILFSLQRYSEALICLKQTIQLKPNAPEFRLDLGRTLTHLHQYEEAIAAYEEAIDLNPNNAAPWSQKGWVLVAMQRYQEAIASYDQALKLNPREAMVWNYLALALAKLQQDREALAAYDQALKLKPNWPTVQNNRAAVLMKLHRYPEAIAACDRAIASRPDEPGIWYNKACCYAIQGDVDRAIENLQQAMQRNPQTYQRLATTDADFDSIRQNPRFQQIVQQPLEGSVSLNPQASSP